MLVKNAGYSEVTEESLINIINCILSALFPNKSTWYAQYVYGVERADKLVL